MTTIVLIVKISFRIWLLYFIKSFPSSVNGMSHHDLLFDVELKPKQYLCSEFGNSPDWRQKLITKLNNKQG